MEPETTQPVLPAPKKALKHMTPEERKLYRRDATRRSREKHKIAEGSISFDKMVELWTPNLTKVMQADISRYIQLCQRHGYVEELEAGVMDLHKVRCHVLILEDTVDPLSTLQEIEEDAKKNGTANYTEIEAAMAGGNWPQLLDMNDPRRHVIRNFTGDSTAEAYKLFGIRLKLDSDTLRQIQELVRVLVPAPEPQGASPESVPDGTGDSTEAANG